MPQHPKTKLSFSAKANQYLSEDCTEPPLIDQPEIKALAADVSGKKVLCVGCGNGAECESFVQMGAVVDGVDDSEALLTIAQTKSSQTTFKVGSIESLPYKDHSFDFLYCSHVLHYIEDWNVSLSEMLRVLKPKSKILLTIHHPFDHGHHGEGKIAVHDVWYEDFEVVYYPRSVEEMKKSFNHAQLTLCDSIELPSDSLESPLAIVFLLLKPEKN